VQFSGNVFDIEKYTVSLLRHISIDFETQEIEIETNHIQKKHVKENMTRKNVILKNGKITEDYVNVHDIKVTSHDTCHSDSCQLICVIEI
jgi:hypothetical protein